MKDIELKALRDRHFFLCYKKALKENDFHNQWEAIEYVRTHPAPRFYISSKTCSLLLGKIFAAKPLEQMNPLAYRRIKRLEKMYRAYIRENIDIRCLSREKICEILVELPAPEFYITNNYATRIIAREISKYNEENCKR